MNFKRLFVATMAVLLVAQISVAPVAASPSIDFNDDRAPNPYVQEDVLTVAEHNTGDMSSLTQYYDDNGDVADLPATVNSSQDAPAGVRFDRIDSEDYRLFPRVSGEDGNAQTWSDASNWTKSSGGTSSMSISQADGSTASGVPAVEVAGTVSSSETATANFSQEVSITSDADKRVMFFVGNVDTLASSATVEIRAVDGDGDYRYAEVNASADANSEDVIANGTGNGFVFQEKLANLPMAGNGDGSMSAIESVEVVAAENDATVTIVGLDVGKKGEYDLGEVEVDRDGEAGTELETVQNYWEGGDANVSTIDSLGTFADGESIMDLKVYDVEYRFSDLSDSDDYHVEFREAEDYGGYSQMLEMTGRLEVPTQIDLSHGTLELRDDQGLVGDRYKVAEVATATGDTALDNVSESDYSDVSSSYSSKGETVTLMGSGINPGESLIFTLEVALQDDEASALQSVPVAGPTGAGGGGILSFIMSPLGLVGGIVGAAAAYAKGWLSWVPYLGGS